VAFVVKLQLFKFILVSRLR